MGARDRRRPVLRRARQRASVEDISDRNGAVLDGSPPGTRTPVGTTNALAGSAAEAEVAGEVDEHR
jgi:hypothetical protein